MTMLSEKCTAKLNTSWTPRLQGDHHPPRKPSSIFVHVFPVTRHDYAHWEHGNFFWNSLFQFGKIWCQDHELRSLNSLGNRRLFWPKSVSSSGYDILRMRLVYGVNCISCRMRSRQVFLKFRVVADQRKWVRSGVKTFRIVWMCGLALPCSDLFVFLWWIPTPHPRSWYGRTQR